MYRQKYRDMAVALFISIMAGLVLPISQASATPPTTVLPYGEVARFGGFDAGATYLTSGTAPTGNLGKTDEPAKLVYPLGMAVDDEDPTAPDKYAIYVLENTNPQALDAEGAQEPAPTNLTLEYRIQKISDSGMLLASTTFSLVSSSSEPGLHAVSLAVNGPADRVYVLMMDVPPVAENSSSHGAVDAIDAWTTGRDGPALEPAIGITTGIDDDLHRDSRTGGGELAGPSALQGLGSNGFFSDLDGAGIAVYGHGADAELALGGNQYTEASASTPVIKLIKTAGAEAGKVDSSVTWGGASAVGQTETVAAKEAGQSSKYLYSMSTNPTGSLNVAFGERRPDQEADLEPNMATIGSSSLSPTTALLPAENVGENFLAPTPLTGERYNKDAAATIGLSQDVAEDGSHGFMPSGATKAAGTLAPSVVQIEGGDGELYAGLVTHEAEQTSDQQNPIPSTPPTWKDVEVSNENQIREITNPASLAIRVFDPAGESLATIGNAVAGGPCNLQSSVPNAYTFHTGAQGEPSFVALAAGREGVVFALVQPDLLNVHVESENEIAPASAVAADEGDQIVEFAPGSGSVGAGANAPNWKECPQPEGGFAITAEKEPPSTGSGEVIVSEGAKVAFSSEVDLHGGSPWAYDWDLEGGVTKAGTGPLFEFPWTVRNTFTAAPESGAAYTWPLSTAEADFKTAGVYTETLQLVSDFGTHTVQRMLRVVATGPLKVEEISFPASPTENSPVLFKAVVKLPAGDKVKDYHWEFGDGVAEDTGEHSEVEHTYAKSGEFSVKLTATDVLGHKVEEVVKVVVAAQKTTTTTTSTTNSTSTTSSATTSTTSTTTTSTKKAVVKHQPTKAELLKAALKACKKDKSKKKRAKCEKQAKAKYGSKPKPKGKKHEKKKK